MKAEGTVGAPTCYYWLSGMFTPALAKPVLPRLPGRGG
jgi:hypothetical protein